MAGRLLARTAVHRVPTRPVLRRVARLRLVRIALRRVRVTVVPLKANVAKGEPLTAAKAGPANSKDVDARRVGAKVMAMASRCGLTRARFSTSLSIRTTPASPL